MSASICLVMIVKNEAAIIRRCLRSVRPIISHWVICDTGSSDQTEDLVRDELAGIPGELFQDEWLNFSHNRNLGLQRAKGKADYHLLLDADMVLNWADPFPSLLADAYFLRFTGNLDYAVIRIVRDGLDWCYQGPTHECVECAHSFHAVNLPLVTVTHFEDGASRQNKYQRDIQILEKALVAEPQNARYTFYLAQSYRDAQQLEKAFDWYERRARMVGWNEETWCALYQMGRMQSLLEYDWRVVLNSYLQAYNFRPSRLEPVFWISRFYREHGQYALGYHFARLLSEVAYPTDVLFVERDVYEYLLPIEYALCCDGTGRRAEARRIYSELLASSHLPTQLREGIAQAAQ